MYLHIKEEDLKNHKGDIEIFIDEYKIKSNINIKELSIVQNDLDDLSNPLWLNRPTKQIIYFSESENNVDWFSKETISDFKLPDLDKLSEEGESKRLTLLAFKSYTKRLKKECDEYIEQINDLLNK